jgi:hypothetical protein
MSLLEQEGADKYPLVSKNAFYVLLAHDSSQPVAVKPKSAAVASPASVDSKPVAVASTKRKPVKRVLESDSEEDRQSEIATNVMPPAASTKRKVDDSLLDVDFGEEVDDIYDSSINDHICARLKDSGMHSQLKTGSVDVESGNEHCPRDILIEAAGEEFGNGFNNLVVVCAPTQTMSTSVVYDRSRPIKEILVATADSSGGMSWQFLKLENSLKNIRRVQINSTGYVLFAAESGVVHFQVGADLKQKFYQPVVPIGKKIFATLANEATADALCILTQDVAKEILVIKIGNSIRTVLNPPDGIGAIADVGYRGGSVYLYKADAQTKKYAVYVCAKGETVFTLVDRIFDNFSGTTAATARCYVSRNCVFLYRTDSSVVSQLQLDATSKKQRAEQHVRNVLSKFPLPVPVPAPAPVPVRRIAPTLVQPIKNADFAGAPALAKFMFSDALQRCSELAAVPEAQLFIDINEAVTIEEAADAGDMRILSFEKLMKRISTNDPTTAGGHVLQCGWNLLFEPAIFYILLAHDCFSLIALFAYSAMMAEDVYPRELESIAKTFQAKTASNYKKTKTDEIKKGFMTLAPFMNDYLEPDYKNEIFEAGTEDDDLRELYLESGIFSQITFSDGSVRSLFGSRGNLTAQQATRFYTARKLGTLRRRQTEEFLKDLGVARSDKKQNIPVARRTGGNSLNA